MYNLKSIKQKNKLLGYCKDKFWNFFFQKDNYLSEIAFKEASSWQKHSSGWFPTVLSETGVMC